MNNARWNQLAAKAKVRSQIAADPIVPLYHHLLGDFARRAPIDWPGALIGLHVAYGWMPTIPDLSRPAGLSAVEKRDVVALLNDARIRILTAPELATLKQRLCNNSMVGLSKLLHFLAPATYPIWDSRVAKNWYAPRGAYPRTYQQPTEYLDYCKQVQLLSTDPVTAAARAHLRSLSPDLAGVSDVRLIELVLFHA